MSAQNSTGGAWLLPGFGVFQGAAGDNAPHAHCAHQIVIGLFTVTWRSVSHSTASMAAGQRFPQTCRIV